MAREISDSKSLGGSDLNSTPSGNRVHISFFGRRRLITKKKITAVAAEISPSTIPEASAVRIVLISVFAPIEMVMKNVTIG